MDEDKLIEERKEELNKIFSKNIYVKTFSILAAIFIIAGLARLASDSIPLINNFDYYLLIFLGVAFFASAIIAYFERYELMFIPVLLWLIFLGVDIRSLPMQDHGGHPGLWDITTNTWTLGPDLDPWLFYRYAKTIVDSGSLPVLDKMRNVPLGFDTSTELQMVSYMIVLTYKIVNLFGSYSVEFAAVFMPVLFFVLTILSFFLLVREIFVRKNSEDKNIKANLIALISTGFMIVIPIFLSRTIAGIPEKESIGFFFMFLAFYLFLKSWKTDKFIPSLILSIFAGVSTALMGLSWGGVVYVYVTIAFAMMAAFLLGKVSKKETWLYFFWVLTSITVTFLFTTRYSLRGFLLGTDTGLVSLVLVIIVGDFILGKLGISQKVSKKIKLPENITSLIILIVISLILVSIYDFSFIIDRIKFINDAMFNPVTGRWSTTVAENRQPDFKEWSYSFGPFIKTLPVMFWLFFIGSVALFKRSLKNLRKKDSWILTLFFILFLCGLIFSRYSSSGILNGENMISKLFYFGSAILLILVFIYYYVKYEREGNKGFDSMDFEYILLFVLFVLCLFTARGAVRLIMVLGTIAPIFASFLIVNCAEEFRKAKDETMKMIFGLVFILFLILSIFAFASFYTSVKSEAYSYVPSYYNQQWQKAMQWVRDETPKNSVFAHWWDYGYWVQSIGDRATVIDGGNAIVFWNYYMGRLVLTGDNPKDALDFLYAHNATHLLIDSSDIGKYGAFSSIGSNENYDRYSWIGTYLVDEKSTMETNNQTIYVYAGGTALDEDLILNDSGKEVLLPGQKTGVGAILLPIEKKGNTTTFGQPFVVFVYNNKQYKEPMRYLYIDEKLVDFKSGLESCAFIFPQITQQDNKVSSNTIGAAMFLSPRLMRSMLIQVYLLNDPFNRFSSFKVVHKEPNLIIDQLRNQGMNLPDFVYFQGVQGPITIWKIQYTGNEQVQQKYLDRDSSKYLSWQL